MAAYDGRVARGFGVFAPRGFMSVKWQRVKRWDDEHIPPVLAPLKWVLRAFSSITLAVILLTLVAVYGVLASVPLGLIAWIPTKVFYGVTIVAAVVVGAGVPIGLAWFLGLRRAGRAAKVVTIGGMLIVLGTGAVWAWYVFAWPVLHYDPATGRGVRFFAGLIDRYQATTLRRLPGLEMSELEFYSWWPLRLILSLFVVNMVAATVRRIEFTFVNLGVLTVHTGIVLIALGSVFYSNLKKEGDTILLAGEPGADGKPTQGPAQNRFYDNTDVALYVQHRGVWEQRALRGVPRYNEYNLSAASGETAGSAALLRQPWDLDPRLTAPGWNPLRPLEVAVPGSRTGLLDGSVSMRIVGYAPYAEPFEDWLRVDPAAIRVVREGVRPSPLRIVKLFDQRPASLREAGEAGDPERPVFSFTLAPGSPKSRLSDSGVFSIEYTMGMSEGRWRALSAELPAGSESGLVVEVPAAGYRGVIDAAPGSVHVLGETGYRVEVKERHPTPPFPIITEGYRGATSAVVVARVTKPDGSAFDRWVYDRFPEIGQDMLDEVNERGMPVRRDADPSIVMYSVDASRLHVFMDERSDGSVRVLVRTPATGASEQALDPKDNGFELVEHVRLRLTHRWEHAERFVRPRPVASEERDKRFVGTHDKAMLGVELREPGAEGSGGWSRVVWLPFNKYLGFMPEAERAVTLPNGEEIVLAFGRRQHRLPGFEISLIDFEMLAYDHRGAPRDYQSLVEVTPALFGVGGGPSGVSFEAFRHVVKLNAPLRAPFHWDPERAWLPNTARRLAAGLNPNQFKFSQAGWDAQGWEETQAQADAGVLPRPRASFTILGVGNNPGIHVIALGGVLIGVGTPWAFYVKPWLLRRRRDRIKREVGSRAGSAGAGGSGRVGEREAEAVGASA